MPSDMHPQSLLPSPDDRHSSSPVPTPPPLAGLYSPHQSDASTTGQLPLGLWL